MILVIIILVFVAGLMFCEYEAIRSAVLDRRAGFLGLKRLPTETDRQLVWRMCYVLRAPTHITTVGGLGHAIAGAYGVLRSQVRVIDLGDGCLIIDFNTRGKHCDPLELAHLCNQLMPVYLCASLLIDGEFQ